MKLYDSPFAPNPRRVRMFLAEKGISVPTEMVDLAKMQQKDPGFSALNPLQRIPVLELDSGEILCESVAICRYFDEIQPAPPLFGTNPLEKARVEMWQRRAELEFFFPIAHGISVTATPPWWKWKSRRSPEKAEDTTSRPTSPSPNISTANWPGGGLSRATSPPSPTSPPASPPKMTPSRRALNFLKTSRIWPVAGGGGGKGEAPRPGR